jgi:hypothetical protein
MSRDGGSEKGGRGGGFSTVVWEASEGVPSSNVWYRRSRGRTGAGSGSETKVPEDVTDLKEQGSLRAPFPGFFTSLSDSTQVPVTVVTSGRRRWSMGEGPHGTCETEWSAPSSSLGSGLCSDLNNKRMAQDLCARVKSSGITIVALDDGWAEAGARRGRAGFPGASARGLAWLRAPHRVYGRLRSWAAT